MSKRLLVLIALLPSPLNACVAPGSSSPVTTTSSPRPAATQAASRLASPTLSGSPQTGTGRPPATPAATSQLARRLSEDRLGQAIYTVCGEKVQLQGGTGITEKPGLDYARQCKVRVAMVVFGDLDGDQFEDAAVVLETFERSHRIPSVHGVVDVDGQPREVAHQELAWEREVTAMSLANREAVLTVKEGPTGGATETVRFRLPGQ